MKCSSFGKFRFRNPSNISTGRISLFGHDECTRPTTELLCASYQTNCRRGGKIVVVIRRKGHSPQKLRDRCRVPPRVMTPKRALRSLTDVHTYHKYIASRSSSSRPNSSNIHLSANLNQIYFNTSIFVLKK